MTKRMTPTSSQRTYLLALVRGHGVGNVREATRVACRHAGWVTRDGEITDAGRFVLAEMERAGVKQMEMA